MESKGQRGAGRRHGLPLWTGPGEVAAVLQDSRLLSSGEGQRLRDMGQSFDSADEDKGRVAFDRSLFVSSSGSSDGEDPLRRAVLSQSLSSNRRSVSPLAAVESGGGRILRHHSKGFLSEAHHAARHDASIDEWSSFLEKRLTAGEVISRSSEEAFLERFALGFCIGEGATSSVRLAERKSDRVEVAVKTIDADVFRTNRALFREIAILSKVEHPNIIKFYEAVMTDDHLYLVMELARGEPLFEAIVRLKVYSESDARNIMKTLLGAVGYLHSVGIVHRDLKPENVIVDSHDMRNLKIVDFGFAGFDSTPHHGGLSTPVGGTPGYRAPDMTSGRSYGAQVDVWSCGVIAYILLGGFPPFFSHPDVKDSLDFLTNAPYWYFINEDTPELRAEIRQGKVQFPSPFWDHVTIAAEEFVLALLRVNEHERLTCAQALAHEWFRTEIPAVAQQTHLLLDVFNSCDEPDLDRSLAHLPLVARDRINRNFDHISSKLDEKLAARPTLAELKKHGIYYSATGL